jgi:pyruvate,water dikinase
MSQVRGSGKREMPVDVLAIGEPGCDDERVVGAKAANLSRLAANYRVPPGFVIPAQHASAEVSSALRDAVLEGYDALGRRIGEADPLVAVRSSALDEDAIDASFAGQHATYLGVRGEAALIEAVSNALASAGTPAALAYRQARGVQTEDVRIAVLVQQLVAADVSVVAFSMNTVSGDPDEVVINASWGLGEPVVSGTVTPDAYLVSALEFNLIRRDVGDKRVMLAVDADGVATVPVPEDKRLAPSLSEAQAIEVARLACSLESRMGWAVDIECAWKDGLLYLLQCRPITTATEAASA